MPLLIFLFKELDDDTGKKERLKVCPNKKCGRTMRASNLGRHIKINHPEMDDGAVATAGFADHEVSEAMNQKYRARKNRLNGASPNTTNQVQCPGKISIKGFL